MPLFLSLFIVFCIWLQFEKRKSIRLHKEYTATLLKEERFANVARKQDISSLDYVTITLSELPMDPCEDSQITAFQERARSFVDKKMINLTHMNNRTLKQTYGIANFEILSEYEESFYAFTKLLDEWGTYLYETHQLNDARQVLEYALSVKTEIKHTYSLLDSIQVLP